MVTNSKPRDYHRKLVGKLDLPTPSAGKLTPEELGHRSMIRAPLAMGVGCAGGGEVGVEGRGLKGTDKKIAFNTGPNFLDFFKMRYYIFLNSVLTIIL
jgi:hypothetical protein